MGKQFADDSMTTGPISVSRDKYQNEIPTDQPHHENTTPGEGGFNWSAQHYNTDFSSYGQSVGGAKEASRTSVDVSRADRGADS